MEPSKKLELRQLNAEGELIDGIFCEYCGGLNRADAAECEHCHEHIADQGPDLHSRLQRIHRHASNSQEFSDIADGGIGSVPYERYAPDEQPIRQSFVFRLSPSVIFLGSLFVIFQAVLFIPPSGPSRSIAIVIGVFTAISFCAIAAAIIRDRNA
jgi:hypothetical protein